MHRKYEIEFAKVILHLTEEDIDFGKSHGLVTSKESLNIGHLFPISPLPQQWSLMHEKWRLISLIWAIENVVHDRRDLFDEVNMIWADFNYPSDMKHLISFLPADDPLASEETLFQDIRDFVAEKSGYFGIHGGTMNSQRKKP
ncbi:MAG: DUF2247 family protein [Rhodoplanes sp.]